MSGRMQAQDIGRALLPGFVAAGSGALVYTGVADWPGLDAPELSLSRVPDYPTRSARRPRLVPTAVRRRGRADRRLRDAAVLLSKRLLARPSPGARLVRPGRRRACTGLPGLRRPAGRPRPVLRPGGAAVHPGRGLWRRPGAPRLTKGLAYSVSLASGFRGGPSSRRLLSGWRSQSSPTMRFRTSLWCPPWSRASRRQLPPCWDAVLCSPYGNASRRTPRPTRAPFAVLGAVVGWIVTTALAKG